MNRYWGGLIATTILALIGFYLLYKVFKREEIILYQVFTLSPAMLVVAAILAESVFLFYVWLGFNTGIFNLGTV